MSHSISAAATVPVRTPERAEAPGRDRTPDNDADDKKPTTARAPAGQGRLVDRFA